MENVKRKVLYTFMILVVLIAGLYLFTDWFSKVTGYFVGEDETTKLAKCLDGKGAEFYTGKYCADCEKQREVFGESLKFISVVECEVDRHGRVIDTRCKNIRGVPAWYLGKDVGIVYGYKNFTELQRISGCED
jgi:hypothetical protein